MVTLTYQALLTIPTFFIDEAWKEDAKVKLEELIYSKAANFSDKLRRMVAVCDQINTFIRIDFALERNSAQQKEEPSRDNEPLWDMRKDKDVGHRPAAALYVFMLVQLDEKLYGAGPLWKQRVSLLKDKNKKGPDGPLPDLVKGFLSKKR